MARMDDETRKKIYEVAARGEYDHGSDGVVMYEPELEETMRIQWVRLSDVKPLDFQEQLRDLLSEESKLFAFVMQVEGPAAHLWKIPRVDILKRRN